MRKGSSLTSLAAAIGLAAVAIAPLLAQTATTGAKTAPGRWTAPRTADGQPDLTGIWNFSSLTPLERPSQFAAKETLTDEEAAEFARQALERTNADRRSAGAEADVNTAYNNFWYDRGSNIRTNRTSLLVNPADGHIPALSPEGQKRADARAESRRHTGGVSGPEDRSLAERCLVFGAGPPMVPGPYNNNVQLFQFRDYVIILNEMIHDARIVPLDRRPHLPSSIRRWQGDSRGRWDGDTLIVDTTNFSDKTNFRGADQNLHLTERFTRVDADTLMYEFTVDNPSAFTRKWTVSVPMARSDEPIYEYACHEANYAMSGILKGAREQEKGARDE